MGDRCYVEMTMRPPDLLRFAPFVRTADERWWDDLDEQNNPDLVTVRVYEANYAWYDERAAAAADGMPFFGTHGEGGEYGAYAFAAADGEQVEAPLNHDGYMVLAVDDDLKPVDDIEELRAYINKLRAVKRLFGIDVTDGGTPADQQAEGPAVPAGLRAA